MPDEPSDWYTKEEVADPQIRDLPKVTGWRILVRPLPVREKTDMGLFLPDASRDMEEFTITVGRVLAIGPRAYERRDMLTREGEIEAWCEVEDYVLYGKYTGIKIVCGDVKLRIMNDDEIIAVLSDPHSIRRY